MKRSYKVATALLATVTLLTAAACSSSGGSSASQSGNGNTAVSGSSAKTSTVHAGIVAYAGIAGFVLGVQKGIFKKHGLDVKWKTVASPAAILSAVSSGSLQFGFTTTPSLIQAVQNGVHVKCVAPADGVGDPNPKIDNNGLLVAPNSDITSPKQLEGKKVGVQAIGSLNNLVAANMVAKAGGDPSAVHFVQLPFPQAGQALQSGQVSAAVVTSPFTEPLLAKGYKSLGYAEHDGGIMHGIMSKCFAVSTSYLSSHRNIVKDFVAAQNETMTYAQAHQNEALSMLPLYLKISKSEAAKSITAVVYKPGLKTSDIGMYQDLMLKYGWIKKKLPVSDYAETP